MKPVAVIALIVGSWLAAAPASAADGTLVVEVVTSDGRKAPADVEVRKQGSDDLLKTIAAVSGEGQTKLAAGNYLVTGRTRTGRLEGQLAVTVRAGKTSRYRVEVAATAQRGTTRATERAAREMAGGSGLRGTVVDGGGRPLEGTARITLTVPVVAGKFQIDPLPPGSYRVEFQPKAKGKTASKDVTVGAAGAEVTLQVE